MTKLLLCVFTCMHMCYASFLRPIEISDDEEGFVKGETQYLLLNVRVTWDEAAIICESYKNGSLAIIDAEAIREFLGEALSESDLEMEDLWVGARMVDGVAGYSWINNGGSYHPDKYFIRRGKEDFTDIHRNCLAFARQSHKVGQFINLECNLRRPFICEKPFEKIFNGSMTTPDWITIGNYKYGIFYDRKTWKQSVRECRRKHHAHLASFRNNDEVKTIAKFELIGRPSLESAWIGGIFKNGYWRFMYDDIPLSEVINNNTMFPPWRRDRSLKHAGCLLLDRHLAKYAVFVEANCGRRRSYICTKELRYEPDFSVVIINNTGYIIYYSKKNWEDAAEHCLNIGANLVTVTLKNIHDITYIMGENVTEVNHIWIGGKLTQNGSHFYWIIDNATIIKNYKKDINLYPPWYDNEYDQNYACLNMDRENHIRPIFYGAACDTPQAYICEQKNLSLLSNLEAKIKVIPTPVNPT